MLCVASNLRQSSTYSGQFSKGCDLPRGLCMLSFPQHLFSATHLPWSNYHLLLPVSLRKLTMFMPDMGHIYRAYSGVGASWFQTGGSRHLFLPDRGEHQHSRSQTHYTLPVIKKGVESFRVFVTTANKLELLFDHVFLTRPSGRVQQYTARRFCLQHIYKP